MKLFSFTLWMIGFPLACEYSSYLSYLQGITYSEGVVGMAAVINLAIWVIIGRAIYKKID